MLYLLILDLIDSYSFLNVFKYLTVRTGLAVFTSLLVVFLIGMTYSIRLSFLTLLAYLAEGAIGLPVFAAGGGLMYLTGPTAGYLYGMLIAVVIISYFANKGYSSSYFKSLLSLLIASVVIFGCGILYLGSIIGFEKAIQAGLLPFIPSEIFKIVLAVLIIPNIQKFINSK